MATARLLVAVALGLGLAGCEAGKVTEIIVSVNTDLKVPPANPPKQIRQVIFQVERNLISDPGQEPHGEVVIKDPWDLTPMPGEEGHVTLPATVGLLPGEYTCKVVLTEESFHGSGDDLYDGNWAQAMEGMISFRSFLRRIRLLRMPRIKSILRLLSWASSTISVSYWVRYGSEWASASRMPSVMTLMKVAGWV